MPTANFGLTRTEPLTQHEHVLVKHIRQHSLDHYTENGWDELYECYTDDMILDLIDKADVDAMNLPKAIASVEKWLKISKAYADDIRNA